MKQRHAYYPIVVSILAFFCFLVIVLFISKTVQPLWGRTLPLVLPSVILCVVGIFAAKGMLSRTATVILTTVLALVLAVCAAIYTLVLSVWVVTTDTTDLRYYTRAYQQIADEDTVKDIFPKAVPDAAENVSFSYTPQFLQGGEVFELSYTVSEQELRRWEAVLETASEWIGSHEEWCENNGWLFFGPDAVRYQLMWDGGVNHGTICYVLIDAELGRITFYYSKW